MRRMGELRSPVSAECRHGTPGACATRPTQLKCPITRGELRSPKSGPTPLRSYPEYRAASPVGTRGVADSAHLSCAEDLSVRSARQPAIDFSAAGAGRAAVSRGAVKHAVRASGHAGICGVRSVRPAASEGMQNRFRPGAAVRRRGELEYRAVGGSDQRSGRGLEHQEFGVEPSEPPRKLYNVVKVGCA